MELIMRVLDFLDTKIWDASVVHWFMPVLMLIGLAVFFVLFAKRNRIRTIVKCPVLQKMEELELDVNVFRNPSKHAGLDVTACSEFLDGKVTCGKACLYNPDVQAVHAEERRKHQEDMKKGNIVVP